jgi:hypothetical protein
MALRQVTNRPCLNRIAILNFRTAISARMLDVGVALRTHHRCALSADDGN